MSVLREALANAVVHREYGDFFKGSAVTVDIYPDRVVIANPGGLWGGRTKENIAEGVSCCRNDTIMRLMSAALLPDNSGSPAEGQGSGIPLMINEMRSRALRPPEFKPTIDSFSVVLARGGAEIDANREWLQSRYQGNLGRFQETLLLLVRRNAVASVSEIHEETGVDSDEIRRAASELTNRGLLAPTSEGGYRIRDLDEGPMGLDERINALLSQGGPVTASELARVSGAPISTVRTHLRRLVEEGTVIATAPPQSRKRAYLLA